MNLQDRRAGLNQICHPSAIQLKAVKNPFGHSGGIYIVQPGSSASCCDVSSERHHQTGQKKLPTIENMGT
jgi:hypothetical protein